MFDRRRLDPETQRLPNAGVDRALSHRADRDPQLDEPSALLVDGSVPALCGDQLPRFPQIRVTGNKLKDKMYHHHTGYIGNLKSINLEKLLDEAPERAIQYAVKGMLPKGQLGRQMLGKLRVFAGPEHNHAAQQPMPLDVNA